MAEALRLALLEGAARSPRPEADGPGVIVLDLDGTPAFATPAARRRLGEVADSAAIPDALLALEAATRAAADGRATDLVRSRIRAADGGWFVLHGSVTDDGEQVAIVIERARAAELADIIVSTCGFTAREQEVVSLVLRGHSNKQIALMLAISGYHRPGPPQGGVRQGRRRQSRRAGGAIARSLLRAGDRGGRSPGALRLVSRKASLMTSNPHHPQRETSRVLSEDRVLDCRPAMPTHWEIARSTADTGGEFLETVNSVGTGPDGGPLVERGAIALA